MCGSEQSDENGDGLEPLKESREVIIRIKWDIICNWMKNKAMRGNNLFDRLKIQKLPEEFCNCVGKWLGSCKNLHGNMSSLFFELR